MTETEPPLEFRRGAEDGPHALGDHGRLIDARQVAADHDELVAAEPGEAVARPKHGDETLCHEPQQLIAGSCPSRSLTSLKWSRSQKSTATVVRVRLARSHGELDAVFQEPPVGQTRQRVVEGSEGERLIDDPAFGDITGVGDDARDRRRVQPIRVDGLDPAPGSVAMAHPHLRHGLGGLPGEQALQHQIAECAGRPDG